MADSNSGLMCHNSWVAWTQEEQDLGPTNVCNFCGHVIRQNYVEVLRTIWSTVPNEPTSWQWHYNMHPECAQVCGYK